jgi:hypothetical protein
VERANDVRAIVHRDVGLVGDGGADVLVVRLVVLALDGEDLHTVIAHEVRGHIILRGERIRGAERDLGATGLERRHEVGRLRRHVQAC